MDAYLQGGLIRGKKAPTKVNQAYSSRKQTAAGKGERLVAS